MNNFEEVVLTKGSKWALSSCKIINTYLAQAMIWEQKAEQYPVKDFYFSQDTRKNLIEKRNEALNCALSEINSWNLVLGKCVVEVPKKLRPWQENCSVVKDAIKQFLLLERNATSSGFFKVG